MKYNVGDKVRVRSDLKEYERYYMEDGQISDTFISPMMNLKGQVVTIRKIYDEKYLIEESRWNWTDEMFEGLAEETPRKFHVYDTVKHLDFGIGTVIEVNEKLVLVDFDEWQMVLIDNHTCYCDPKELTLVEAYTGGEDDD